MVSPKGRHIVLLGFMGSGKTTVGQRIAKLTNLPFVDTDRLVEERAGKSIPDIFSQEGEETFRLYETEALRHALAGPRRVIATGGGIVTQEENWALMADQGVTVWLRVAFDVLCDRLTDSTGRPLLAGDRTWERTRRLYLSREPLYRRADIWVDGEPPVGQVAETVVRSVANLLATQGERVE